MDMDPIKVVNDIASGHQRVRVDVKDGQAHISRSPKSWSDSHGGIPCPRKYRERFIVDLPAGVTKLKRVDGQWQPA